MDQTIGAGGPAVITASSRGLTWTIRNDPGNTTPVLAAVNVPDPLPAMVAPAAVQRPAKPFDGNGLDGSELPMQAAAVLPWVPGAPGYGVIIDRRYAELAAGYNLTIGEPAGVARGRGAADYPAEADGSSRPDRVVELGRLGCGSS